MSYLLDTHIVLWLASSPDKLSNTVKTILQDYDSDIYFSAINLWEIAIKNQLNKQYFDIDTSTLILPNYTSNYLYMTSSSFPF